jgi:predicted choloylglycine hydrolase
MRTPLSRRRFFGILALTLVAASLASAAEPRAFQEAFFKKGELKYINDIPVLIVAGTPEEMGHQKAVLTADVMKTIAEYPQRLLERASHKDRSAKYLEMSKAIANQLPESHREEMRSFAEHSGVDRNIGLLANMLPDVYRDISCSSLIVEPAKSVTGGPLFGRNLDFYTLKMLDKYSLVTVQRPTGKHAFVSIGFPGMFGCLSGMNDAGLALAVHEVFLAHDGAPIFNPKGMPYTFCFRRILEECTTIEEAEKMLRETERTTILNLAVCDTKHAVVLEMTPKTVATRHSSDGILACTNHFRTDELRVFQLCNRYPKLMQARHTDKLDLHDVAKKMDEVNMGKMTVQTMIFEPASLMLYVAIGGCPSSSQPMKTVDLKPLFTAGK